MLLTMFNVQWDVGSLVGTSGRHMFTSVDKTTLGEFTLSPISVPVFLCTIMSIMKLVVTKPLLYY